MTDTDLLIDQHTKTTRLTTPELVRQLNAHLGPTLVAALANVRDRKLPHKWAMVDGPVPRDESLRRLQAAHRVWRLISGVENDYTARAWFIGANPRLDEQSPVMQLRDGEVPRVIAAARAFVEGSDD